MAPFGAMEIILVHLPLQCKYSLIIRTMLCE